MVTLVKNSNSSCLAASILFTFSLLTIAAPAKAFEEVTFDFVNPSSPSNDIKIRSEIPKSVIAKNTDEIQFDFVGNNSESFEIPGLSNLSSIHTGLFKLKYITAIESDLRFKQGKSNYIKINKDNQNIYLIRSNAASEPMPTEIGYINPSKVIPADHYLNPFNVFVLTSGLAEGNAVIEEGVYYQKPDGMAHFDPGNSKLNVSVISAQNSKNAHESIRQMANGDYGLDTQIKIAKSNLYMQPAVEFSALIKDGLTKSPAYKENISLVELVNLADWKVQAFGTADYDAARKVTKYWKAKDCLLYLKKHGFSTNVNIDGKNVDVSKWPEEVLRVYTTRLHVYDKYESQFGGMARIAVQNGRTFKEQASSNQGDRVWALRAAYSTEGFKRLLSAKISAFSQ